MVQENDHPLLVLEYEGVDDLHVGLLGPELHQVCQVLQALCDHDERPRRGGRRRVGEQVELPRVEDGRAEEAEENEAGDGARLHQALVRPLGHHVALEAAANVPEQRKKKTCGIIVWPSKKPIDYIFTD